MAYKDVVVPLQPSVNFAAKCSKIPGADRVKLEWIQGTEHTDPGFEAPENVNIALDFLDEQLKTS